MRARAYRYTGANEYSNSYDSATDGVYPYHNRSNRDDGPNRATSYSNARANRVSCACVNGYSYAGAYVHHGANVHGNSYKYARSYHDANTGADLHTYSDTGADGHGCSNSNTHGDFHATPNQYSCSAYSHVYANTGTHAGTHTRTEIGIFMDA